MGTCNIDHSLADVKQKLENQKPYMPADLAESLETVLTTDLTQESLNDLFHLLKKYDLASQKERQERNDQLAVYT